MHVDDDRCPRPEAHGNRRVSVSREGVAYVHHAQAGYATAAADRALSMAHVQPERPTFDPMPMFANDGRPEHPEGPVVWIPFQTRLATTSSILSRPIVSSPSKGKDTTTSASARGPTSRSSTPSVQRATPRRSPRKHSVASYQGWNTEEDDSPRKRGREEKGGISEGRKKKKVVLVGL
jgi:hypothetical protein